MIVCVSSPNRMVFCDSIRSPQGVTRPAAAGGASQIASFHVNNKKNEGLGSKLIDLRRPSSFQVCVRRRKLPLPGLCFVSKENEAQVAEDGKQSLEFAGSLRKNVESEQERLTREAKAILAAVAWSLGITGTAAAAIYYRFVFVMQGEELPYTEMLETVLVAAGAAVGMEYWARWVHRAFWHASLWCIHESHHRPRDGPFEMNDVFTILNSVPANVLLTYGLYCKGLVPSLCFGAGVGITVGGIAYILVHDGLIDRRFPVGPIGDVPYLRKVAAAHQIHHSDKFNGVPYGILLGPMELEKVEGGLHELQKFVNRRKKTSKGLSEAKDLRS